jgi:tetratricopeptide (TPR) repeat protein
MAEPRRPSAGELDQLIESFRRDPGRGFVALGNAYLALGRPRDAIEIGALGLKSEPGNLDGRVMVAYAFAQLHQWKEAQAELLKVVKTDRSNAFGFRLLGEVLMRRADYERALPVLQHAQNLAPADPVVLALLKRARTGQPLDPPPPPPVAVAPAQAGARPTRPPPASRHDDPYPIDDMPTRVAGEIGEQADDGVLARMELERREIQAQRAPIDRGARRVDDRGRDREERRPVEVHQPPPSENPLAPLGADPRMAHMPTLMAEASPGPAPHAGMAPAGQPSRGQPGSYAPPPGQPAVRPRVFPVEKPKDAAQASLRQSVAVGEDYLNNLLAGGLLDVPRVRVAEPRHDVSPDRRWGRSTFRMFIYLFALLFLAAGGAGTWLWYAEKQKAEDVARYLESATAGIEHGDHAGLVAADTAARAALERDRGSPYAVAVLAEITALESFLYRELEPAEVEKAIALAARDIDDPGDRGYRELLVARGADALSRLSADDEGSDRRLAEASAALEAWLADHGDDVLVRWLAGEARLAAGSRAAARAAFEQAHDGGNGSVLATIALGNLELDAARYDAARALFDSALSRAPRHPWAFLGRSLVRSERSLELEEAMGDLNVGVSQDAGPRVAAYKRLALATALYGLEDYATFAAELDQARGVDDPRFLARVGLLRVAQGKIADAAAARSTIRWYAAQPEGDPLVALLDAELLLARGLPAAALEVIGDQEGLRAARLRGRALFDAGKPVEAIAELGEAIEIAPDDLDTRTWREAARMVSLSGEERRKADEALDSLGRQAKSKATRLAHGLALGAIGRTADARSRLVQSLSDLSDEYPNPLAYRAHVALGELDLAAGKPAEAAEHAARALEHNGGYLPAHDLAGRALVDSDPTRAAGHLAEVAGADAASAGAELVLARILAATDAEAAAAALERARAKGVTVEQLQAQFDRFPADLMTRLGVPPPAKKK